MTGCSHTTAVFVVFTIPTTQPQHATKEEFAGIQDGAALHADEKSKDCLCSTNSCFSMSIFVLFCCTRSPTKLLAVTLDFVLLAFRAVILEVFIVAGESHEHGNIVWVTAEFQWMDLQDCAGGMDKMNVLQM